MEARIKESKTFKPFTLEIDVSSEDELKELWHRFNVYIGTCTDGGVHMLLSEDYPTVKSNNTWNVLEAKRKEMGLE